jgi:hypothetical protein
MDGFGDKTDQLIDKAKNTAKKIEAEVNSK